MTDRKILIIGGFGFLGRNLYQSLIDAGYTHVNIMSDVALSSDDPFKDVFRNELILGSINDREVIERVIQDHEIIFSFAGLSGAAKSIMNPIEDVHVNLEGHLNILEACKHKREHTKLIFPSTRLVYGPPVHLPVQESHPVNPQSIYAIHKNTAEYYYLLYSKLYQLTTVIFRISNPYGYNFHPERYQYSILNQFIYKAVKKEPIQLYGDGKQKRDYLHIRDLSALFVDSVHNAQMNNKIFNIGSGTGNSLLEVVETIQKIIPGTTYHFVRWPMLEKNIETGDYFTDLTKIRSVSGWEPEIDLEEGIRMTAKAYISEQHRS